MSFDNAMHPDELPHKGEWIPEDDPETDDEGETDDDEE